MAFYEKLKNSIKKTKNAVVGKIDDILKSFVKIDEDMLAELEETLICADVGIATTEIILDRLRDRIRDGRLTEAKHKEALRDIISEMIGEGEPLDLSNKPLSY